MRRIFKRPKSKMFQRDKYLRYTNRRKRKMIEFCEFSRPKLRVDCFILGHFLSNNINLKLIKRRYHLWAQSCPEAVRFKSKKLPSAYYHHLAFLDIKIISRSFSTFLLFHFILKVNGSIKNFLSL